MTESNVPPAARRLQAITAPLDKAYVAAARDAEARGDGVVLVEGVSVAMALKRLNQLVYDMLFGVEDPPPVFDEAKLPTLATIAKECAATFNVPFEAMKKPNRSGGRRADARRAYFFISRRIYGPAKSYPVIASVIGLKDHSSAIHGFRTGASLYETNREFCLAVRAIEARLKDAAA
jgi:hypothetical protein